MRATNSPSKFWAKRLAESLQKQDDGSPRDQEWASTIEKITLALPASVFDEVAGMAALEAKVRAVTHLCESVSRNMDRHEAVELIRRIVDYLQNRLTTLHREGDLVDAGLDPARLEKYKDRSDKSESAVSFFERVYRPSAQKLTQGLIRKHDKALYEALHNSVQYFNRHRAKNPSAVSVEHLISGDHPRSDDYMTFLRMNDRRGKERASFEGFKTY